MAMIAAVFLALLLAGCVRLTNYAVYRHPVTGDVLACEVNEVGAGFWGPGAYPACKDAIEARGYERVGTERRETSAQTGIDYTVPRPLPPLR